jgi:hypothetical protein
MNLEVGWRGIMLMIIIEFKLDLSKDKLMLGWMWAS